jgi:hypothetical protein
MASPQRCNNAEARHSLYDGKIHGEKNPHSGLQAAALQNSMAHGKPLRFIREVKNFIAESIGPKGAI